MPARKKTTADGQPLEKKPARKRAVKKAAPPEAAQQPQAEAAEVARTQPAARGKAAGAGARGSLVIVESPAKAKTIQKYLGPGFTVEASIGHIRDLPKSPGRGQIGIDIDAGWVPTYVVEEDRAKQQVAKLKKLVAKAEHVFLATDPDREGEAIAWHLKEELKLDDDRYHRVTFNEITKRAVQEAFAHPRGIDMDRVRAQEARRFLDRGVGYKISPLLRKKLGAESAGRVQSVAVRLIVERELEIEAFKPEEYWKVLALLSPQDLGLAPAAPVQPKVRKKAEGDKAEEEEDKPELEAKAGSFIAELAEWAGKKFAAGNEQEATAVLAALPGAAYEVARVEQKDRVEKAPPPFTTSTLQQQANIRLGFSSSRTMKVAQDLYQGVELGSEGAVALITYMRTDSTRIAADALKSCREHIQGQYGDKYLPAEPNYFASGKSAQEAHEAIRPTDLAYTPQRVAPFLEPDQLKLYDLIYRRFVACQMTPAVFAITNVDVKAAEGLFKAQGKLLKFDGYRRVLAPRGKQEEASLPPLSERQRLDLLDLLASQHFTQPPPRYNEASLVKALEKEGIGRPSTYASIIKTIKDRKYVDLRERRFYATDLGKLVTHRLIEHFPKVMDLKFTSQIEEQLDEIEEGRQQRNRVLDDFWGPFTKDLEAAQVNMQALKDVETGEACPRCGKPLVQKFSRKLGRHFIGCSDYKECKYIKPREGEPERPAAVETEHKCPTCGKVMLQRQGRRGTFLSCSGYPECKTTMNLDAEGKPVLSAQPTEHVCDKCGKPMVLREGYRGKFLGCTGYPKCRNAKEVDAQGNPIKQVDLGIKCEKCGEPMAVRRGPRGPFLGCTAYPKCRSTKHLTEELREKLKDVLPPTPPKKEMPKVEITDICPECGGPMALRQKRFGGGYFLGCKKYPKCKGTREASPDLLEKIMAAMP